MSEDLKKKKEAAIAKYNEAIKNHKVVKAKAKKAAEAEEKRANAVKAAEADKK